MTAPNLGFGDDCLDPRIDAAWEWIVAIDAFDYNDIEPLFHLMSSDKPIPEELRPALAMIIAGTRKPNLRAAAKLKMAAAERMRMAGSISAVLGLINELKTGDQIDLSDKDRPHRRSIDIKADRDGVEPLQIKRMLESRAKEVIVRAAGSLNVSVETIENMLRELRTKLLKYPHV
ncbi:MAG: hypothetical protein QHC67_02925 [Sphingobium sp.]|uniref:hypothetical protein n=1 Tax=Sphingobium sp. TaxID=1912891 RepID=UPI0029BEA6E1|nr:hypothetical protein [Sphingobium sp.]MDX3908751.1 hypothetical protein [Sphingobium sp.]